MNLKMSIARSAKEKTLTRKDDPFEIPICDVGDPNHLNLAGVIEVRTGEAIGMVLWQGVKGLWHGVENWCVWRRNLLNRNISKRCKLSRWLRTHFLRRFQWMTERFSR